MPTDFHLFRSQTCDKVNKKETLEAGIGVYLDGRHKYVEHFVISGSCGVRHMTRL